MSSPQVPYVRSDFEISPPDTWLEHFIRAASPISRYAQPVFQLTDAKLTVSSIQHQSTTSSPSQPFLTPARKAALEERLADIELSLLGDERGHDAVLWIDMFQRHCIIDLAKGITPVFTAFAQLCVDDPPTATGSLTTVTEAQLKKIYRPEEQAKARAMGPIATIYYNLFDALRPIRRCVKCHLAQRALPEAPSEAVLAESGGYEKWSDPKRFLWALEPGVERIVDELGCDWPGKRIWRDSMKSQSQQANAAEAAVTQLFSVVIAMAKTDGLDLEKMWWYERTVEYGDS